MHRPIGETDLTPYRVVSTLVRLHEQGFSTDLDIPGVAQWGRAKLRTMLDAAEALNRLNKTAGALKDHPFFGVRRTDILPTDVQRLQSQIDALLVATNDAGKTTAAISTSVDLSGEGNPAQSGQISRMLRHVCQLSRPGARFASKVAAQGSIGQARKLAEAGQEYKRHAARAEARFLPAADHAELAHLRPMLAEGHGLLGRLGSRYRAASAELQSLVKPPMPKKQPERMALLDELLAWQRARAKFEELSPAGQHLFGDLWQDKSTDFSALNEAAQWTGELLQMALSLNAEKVVELNRFTPGQLAQLDTQVTHQAEQVRNLAEQIVSILQLDLSSVFGTTELNEVSYELLLSKARVWRDHIHRLDEWSQLLAAHHAFETLAGSAFADMVSSGQVSSANLVPTIRFIHAEALYRQFAQQNAWATRLTAEEKAALIGAFRQREKSRLNSLSRLIRKNHLNALPRGGMGAMGLIRSEIGKKRGHKPIRRLMKDAGTIVQQLKPVFLMSPISVAQYLPPGVMHFDLLVIDEASQVRPEDALGAVARSDQIVVVGDRKQLPPTSFFDRVVSDETDEEDDETENLDQPRATGAAELESVLTLCEARGLNTRMLEWHYRSRHPSLIEVSNDNFYDGRLILFPSPQSAGDEDGLQVQRVNGAYDRGGKRNNPIEAEAVARAVAEHARNAVRRSLGVVTFSTAQRDQVTYWLDKLRQDDQALDLFMREGRHEELFVKNIENVQGDERDVIFISVGYGPRTAGARLDSMAFGPISSDGGERRLNVLFTRARTKTKVFTSFNSGDIDLSRTRMAGARVLKSFLQYAESGRSVVPQPTGDDPDSDFEISVANAIRSLGYNVDYQVGSAGFRIDLAVHDPDKPGRYLLAVECDGATYHSALWARERDRQRQEVLEGLGWNFHRVWSTDWFHRRETEHRRLKQALHDALEPELSDDDFDFEPVETPDVLQPHDDPQAAQSGKLPAYIVADFPVSHGGEPHEVPVSQMIDIVGKIVEIEGPVHQDEVARRVAALFGKSKAGSRIAGKVIESLKYLKTRDADLQSDRGFWFTLAQQTKTPLRNRSEAPLNLRRASLLPPIEIAEAIRHVLKDNGALGEQEIPRAVALLFGFQRTGPEFRPAIEPVVEQLLMEGEAQAGSAGIYLSNDTGTTTS